jgi:Lon protease-like protein
MATTRIPLFPLPDVVHFPRTELRLHVFEPRYRALVRDVLARDRGARWVGIVLIRPGERDGDEAPEIFAAGTAGQLVAVDALPAGRSLIRLRGGFRFTIEREVGGLPYRQALVRPLEEGVAAEQDAALGALRRDLVELAGALRLELGERFPFDAEAVEALRSPATNCEEVVNRLAAELDVPPLRKLQLLAEDLPQRARAVAGILRARQRVLDLLRPYRRAAAAAGQN